MKRNPLRLTWGAGFFTGRMALAALGFLAWAGTVSGADYYVGPSGDDSSGDGSLAKKWKTINYAIAQLSGGDTLHLDAGATFTEQVYFAPGTGGSPAAPKTLTSSASNRATIIAPAANNNALNIYNTAGLRFENLRFIGGGMDTHQKEGVSAYSGNARYSFLQFFNCEFNGFGKQGLSIGGWDGVNCGFSEVLVDSCVSGSNRTAGISVWGQYPSANTNVVIRNCVVFDNLGDPNYTASHTGSGIVLGQVTDGLIERCVAYRNGQRCTTTGGPVGIWAYDSTRVTIQFCEAYDNRAVNCDGGGFDLDGGCQDCVIQYCYSHDNDGAGYLICQYSGARAFTGNTVRYNISQNDGRKNGFSGLHFWSSGSSGGIVNTRIYGNTIYNSIAPAVDFQTTGGQSGTRLCNNLFLTTNGLAIVSGNPATGTALFQNNNYWSYSGVVNLAGYASLAAWQSAQNQESTNGIPTGYSVDPKLAAPGSGGTNSTPTGYQLTTSSTMINAGLDPVALFGADIGPHDFFRNAVPIGPACDIGAHEFPAAMNHAPTVTANGSPTNGTAPMLVNFTANGQDVDGDTLSYSWTFGDGQISTSQSPSHIYATTGSYTATVTVSDPLAASGQASVQIMATAGVDPDTDGDGLLDSVDPDDDNDGMSDLDEAVAGTNPTNALSVLRIVNSAFGIPNSEFVIRWQSVSDHWYTVQAASNLLSGFTLNLGTNIFANPPENVYTDSVSGAGQKFYKVRLETGN